LFIFLNTWGKWFHNYLIKMISCAKRMSYACWNLGSNSSLQNRLVRWGLPPLYILFSRVLSIRCGAWVFPNTPPSRPTLFGFGAWTGLGGPWIRQALIPCWNLESSSSLQNRLVRWGLPPLYILFSRVLSISLV